MLALALYTSMLWLLASQARRPTNRVWLALPLIVVWAPDLQAEATAIFDRLGITDWPGRPLKVTAVDARTDASFVIMARTDAAAVEGIDAAIDRACAYVEAGADMIFPEAMKTLDDYRRFKQAVILANLTEFGTTPFFTTDELRIADVDIALYCCGAYRAMNKAALHFYEAVRRDGTQKHVIDTLQTRDELYDFLGYHAYEDKLDELFAGK